MHLFVNCKFDTEKSVAIFESFRKKSPISYDIVTNEHGGTISVDSQIGKFTEFTVRLPRTFGATLAEAAP